MKFRHNVNNYNSNHKNQVKDINLKEREKDRRSDQETKEKNERKKQKQYEHIINKTSIYFDCFLFCNNRSPCRGLVKSSAKNFDDFGWRDSRHHHNHQRSLTASEARQN